MVCKDNIIGIRGACSASVEQATPFFYINDLPGINLQKSANIADVETGTGNEVLRQSIIQGVNQTQSDVINSLLDVVKFGSVNVSRLTGALPDSYIERTTAEGQVLKLSSCSRMQALYIPYLKLRVRDSVAVIVTIEDGNVTTTYNATLTGGVVSEIAIQYKATSREITIKLAAAGGGSLWVSDGGLSYDTGACCNSCDFYYCNVLSTTADGRGNGLQILSQTICDEDALFCEIARYAAKAAWYASGIWFMEYLLSSDRINVYTTYKNDEAIDQIQRWSEVYKDELKALNQRLPKFLLQLDPCCVECNASTWKYSLP